MKFIFSCLNVDSRHQNNRYLRLQWARCNYLPKILEIIIRIFKVTLNLLLPNLLEIVGFGWRNVCKGQKSNPEACGRNSVQQHAPPILHGWEISRPGHNLAVPVGKGVAIPSSGERPEPLSQMAFIGNGLWRCTQHTWIAHKSVSKGYSHTKTGIIYR